MLYLVLCVITILTAQHIIFYHCCTIQASYFVSNPLITSMKVSVALVVVGMHPFRYSITAELLSKKTLADCTQSMLVNAFLIRLAQAIQANPSNWRTTEDVVAIGSCAIPWMCGWMLIHCTTSGDTMIKREIVVCFHVCRHPFRTTLVVSNSIVIPVSKERYGVKTANPAQDIENKLSTICMRQHEEDNSAVVMVNNWFASLVPVDIVEEKRYVCVWLNTSCWMIFKLERETW